MTSNVIDFTVRHLSPRKPAPSVRDSRESQMRAHQRDVMTLRAIEERAHSKVSGLLRFKPWQDQFAAGRALDHLVEKAKSKGILVQAVKEKFPKIDRFRVGSDHDLNAPRTRDTVRKMTKAVRPYLEAARAIAEVAAFDRDECALAVLQDTSLFQNWGAPNEPSDDSPEDELARQLTEILKEFSARIIRDYQLASLFSRMRRMPGCWDLRTGTFRLSRTACLHQTGYREGLEVWEEAPPLPSVPLIRLRQIEHRLTVRLDKRPSAVPETSALFKLPPVAPNEGDERQAQLRVFREIRLALAPTVDKDTLGPLFESRAFAELSLLNDDGSPWAESPLDPSCSVWHLEPNQTVGFTVDGEWRRLTALEDVAAALSEGADGDALMWKGRPSETDIRIGNSQEHEHYYVSWSPVNTAYVRHWLDRGVGSSNAVILAPLLDPWSVNVAQPNSYTWYPSIYVAHHVETAIQDGRLAAALGAEITRVRAAFETHELNWRERLYEQTSDQIARFKEDLVIEDRLTNDEQDSLR